MFKMYVKFRMKMEKASLEMFDVRHFKTPRVVSFVKQ